MRSQAAFSLFAGPRRSLCYACGRQSAAALPETAIYPLRHDPSETTTGFQFSRRRSHSLPVLGVARATPAGAKSLRSCPKRQSTLSGPPLKAVRGILRSQAAFSLFAGPRRSLCYACGRQSAAALPETAIYPLRHDPSETTTGFQFSRRRSHSLPVLGVARATPAGAKSLRSCPKRQSTLSGPERRRRCYWISGGSVYGLKDIVGRSAESVEK